MSKKPSSNLFEGWPKAAHRDQTRDLFGNLTGGPGADKLEYNSSYDPLMAKEGSFSRVVGDSYLMSFGDQTQQRKMAGEIDNEKELSKSFYSTEKADSLSPISFNKEFYNDSPASSGVFSSTSSPYSIQSLGGNTVDRSEFNFDLPVITTPKSSVCLLFAISCIQFD